MVNKALFSSTSSDWETPQWLFDLLDAEYHFTLDPCATPENAKCAQFYTIKEDGLKRRWGGSVWVNPPYGREISQWIEKAVQQIRLKRVERIVMLLPSRTDTIYWHQLIMRKAKEIRFIEGRLRFVGAKAQAPFPSVIVIFDKRLTPIWLGPSINARGRK